MPNGMMRTSAAGLAALRLHEGRGGYYNDSAINCTKGIGVLVHAGPCTPEEAARTVSEAEIELTFVNRVRAAEIAVRQRMTRRSLTEAQFDSLVSVTFNSGTAGAHHVLEAANRGANEEVVRHIKSRVFFHPWKNGARGPAEWSRGLANRRRDEAAPFQAGSLGR